MIEVHPLDAEGLPAASTLLGMAFGPTDQEWLRARVEEGLYLAAHDREGLVAVAGLLPDGQWFAGRDLPTTAIGHVAVAPYARRRGVARTLLTAALARMRAQGSAVSVLYPSSPAVYRAAGWEAAGVLAEADVATVELAGRAGTADADEVVLRPAGAQDAATVHALYTGAARGAVGPLARTGPLFDRARPPKPGAVVLAEVDGAPVGYVRWTARGDRLDVHDLVADRPVASAALLRAVASWHTTLPRTHLRLAGPALATVGTPTAVLARHEPWMLRVVDAPAAVAGRGFPPVDVAVGLDLDDPLVPGNAGRWLLTVAGGAGRLERGGDGAVRLSIRGLAALFTGHLCARDLTVAGLLDGPVAHLARLDVAFASPAPWMLDSF